MPGYWKGTHQERHHGQAAILDLLQLQLVQLLRGGLGVAEGVKGAARVAVLCALEHALKTKKGAWLSLRTRHAMAVVKWEMHQDVSFLIQGSWLRRINIQDRRLASPITASLANRRAAGIKHAKKKIRIAADLAARLADVLPPLALNESVRKHHGHE